jgi:tRNA pseudouridine13 synthase
MDPHETRPDDGARDAALPFVSEGLAPTGGALRAVPEDFRVEEVAAYLPAGAGEHLFLLVEKRLRTTDEVAQALARAARVPPPEVGYAGQKDRQAVTVQWFSLPARAAEAAGLPGAFALDGVRIHEAARHGNRLKTGHLHGNRFRIVLREPLPDALPRAEAIAAVLRARGLPNAYGPQRFGRDGATARAGLALLADPRGGPGARDRYKRKLYVSAAQAWLYNRYLAERLRDGTLARVLPGDVAQRTDSGGLFVVDSDDESVGAAQTRLERREIVTAGPIFGRKTYAAAGPAAEREAALLAAAGVDPTCFEAFGKLALGTRRANVVFLDDLAVAADPGGIALSFTLPAGSYATVVLREFLKAEVG